MLSDLGLVKICLSYTDGKGLRTRIAVLAAVFLPMIVGARAACPKENLFEQPLPRDRDAHRRRWHSQQYRAR